MIKRLINITIMKKLLSGAAWSVDIVALLALWCEALLFSRKSSNLARKTAVYD